MWQDLHLGKVEAPSRGRRWRAKLCPGCDIFFFFNKLDSQLDLAEKSIVGLEKAVKIHRAKLSTPQAAVRLLGCRDVQLRRKGRKKMAISKKTLKYLPNIIEVS